MNEQFSIDVLGTPAFGWPDRRAQFAGDPVDDHVAAINSAIESMLSDDMKIEHLDSLSDHLAGMSPAHAMAVAQQVGIKTARSRKEAVMKLNQKLHDLFYTLRKQRMYDSPQPPPIDPYYPTSPGPPPLPQFSDATQFVDLGMNLHTKTDVQSLDDMRGRRTRSKKYYNVVGKGDFKTAGDQEIQRILQDEDFRQQLNGHIDALQNPDHSKEEWLAVQDFLRNEYKDYHLRNVKRGRMSRIPAKVMRSLMFPFLSSPHMKEFRNERFRAA